MHALLSLCAVKREQSNSVAVNLGMTDFGDPRGGQPADETGHSFQRDIFPRAIRNIDPPKIRHPNSPRRCSTLALG